jgi:ATP-dependent DNA helicase RecG
VVVTEKPDRLIFENEGSFFEGQPNDYMSGEKTPRRYRNPFLTQAMVELNMIDTMGYGIYAMHTGQAKRYFPMPDYDISNDSQVRLVIHGAVADPAYSRLLIKHTDLSLHEILALDRIQKSLPVPDVALRQLRRRGLVEGRRPHLHISAEVAQVTGDKAAYIRTRSQDDDFYCKLVMDYLAKFHQASRSELEDLLLDKLSEALDPQQRVKKISNLLTKMRRNRLISSNGPKKKALWRLQNNAE